MKKRYIIILVLLAAAAVAAWIGYRMYDEKTPDIVNNKPDHTTNASSLLAAFEKDSTSAVRQYIDKVIEISGNVKRVDTSGAVVLGEEGNPSEVVIGLDRRHMKDLEQLQVGKTATLQGVCSGYTTSGGDPDDLLSGLGTTVQFRSAGIKKTIK